MTGTSQRTLVEKLGIKPGWAIALIDPPPGYAALLEPLPDGVILKEQTLDSLQFIQLFSQWRADLERDLPLLKKALSKEGMLWVSWPKRTAKMNPIGDLDENIVRAAGLAAGLVDVKIAAVDDVWSALKFVYRLKER